MTWAELYTYFSADYFCKSHWVMKPCNWAIQFVRDKQNGGTLFENVHGSQTNRQLLISNRKLVKYSQKLPKDDQRWPKGENSSIE